MGTMKKYEKQLPYQIKLWDMANIYVQGTTKDYLNFKQKHMELLVEYRAETDSLNKQISKGNVKIDEIQNKIHVMKEHSLKGAIVRSATKFMKIEEAPSKLFYAAESVFHEKEAKTITVLKDKFG